MAQHDTGVVRLFDVNGMEATVTWFIGAVGLFVVGTLGFIAAKGISQWSSNQAAPLRSVDALVVSRRTEVRSRAGEGNRATSTSYFATFEDESGARSELPLSGAEYGQLAEGDRGDLIHQGTRYKGFTRAGARNA
jgi:hypothetical protein